ncbi:putative alpha/beta hydrolase-1, epoxide hydrolase [Helianthus annuus]|nr:putative alpha/beta hydrolase-1, epoxide hydrolase [Helianthus annuus]
MGADKVFVVGHDWGAMMAWMLCLFRPDKVKALVNLSGHFIPRNPQQKVVETFRALYGDDLYLCRFQEPGEMEAVFASVETKQVLKNFFTHSSQPWYFPKDNPIGDEHNAQSALLSSNSSLVCEARQAFRSSPNELVVIEGAAHFITQQVPHKVNLHIFDILHKF